MALAILRKILYLLSANNSTPFFVLLLSLRQERREKSLLSKDVPSGRLPSREIGGTCKRVKIALERWTLQFRPMRFFLESQYSVVRSVDDGIIQKLS